MREPVRQPVDVAVGKFNFDVIVDSSKVNFLALNVQFVFSLIEVGMMDGAYFTSRTEILDFFNNLLNMSLTKIEQTATGAVACQMFDYIFPGTVQMKRINWGAKTDFQYVENYKVLQNAFQKNRVQKPIDVHRLVRAKYQDNLEFCQWLKAFFDHCNPPHRDDYDPLARRALGKGGRTLDDHFRPGGFSGKSSSRANFPPRRAVAPSTTRKNPTHKSSNSTSTRSRNDKANTLSDRSNLHSPRRNSEQIVAEATLMKKNSDLMDRVAELELTLTGIEKERDFYFEKLRGIEVMLQVHEEKVDAKHADELVKKIFKVLYATSEDNIVVSDEGEVRCRPHNFIHII